MEVINIIDLEKKVAEFFGISQSDITECTATEKSLEITLKKPMDKIEFTIEI